MYMGKAPIITLKKEKMTVANWDGILEQHF
jgi:hypothetical protein